MTQPESDHPKDFRPLSPNSVLSRLTPFEWSDQESVNFEVALETVNLVTAHCSHMIAVEEHRSTPDPGVIERWENLMRQCAAEQQALRSTNHAEVERVTREYSALAKQLDAEAERG